MLIDSTGLTENHYLYTGEQFDQGLGQYYLRARYYDQFIGRFKTMDTWKGIDARPHSLNKYIYTEGDPTNNVDPSGRNLIGLNVSQTIFTVLLTSSTAAYIASQSSGSNDRSVLGNERSLFIDLTVKSKILPYVLSIKSRAHIQASENTEEEADDDRVCSELRAEIASLDRLLHNLYVNGDLRRPQGFDWKEALDKYFELIAEYELLCPDDEPPERDFLDEIGM